MATSEPTPAQQPDGGAEVDVCPFCGSPAEIHEFKDESLFSHAIVTWYRIQCSNPFVLQDGDVRDCPGYVGYGSEDRGELIAAWNRRTPTPPASPERVRVISGVAICEDGTIQGARSGSTRPSASPEREAVYRAVDKIIERLRLTQIDRVVDVAEFISIAFLRQLNDAARKESADAAR